jgi:hypothetical protein
MSIRRRIERLEQAAASHMRQAPPPKEKEIARIDELCRLTLELDRRFEAGEITQEERSPV